jgi:hypothetical protein
MMFLILFFCSSAGETSDFAPCSWTSTQNNSCCGMFIIWLKFALLPFGWNVSCRHIIWCLFRRC